MTSRHRSQWLLRSGEQSPLGQVSLAAFQHGTRGLPPKQMRVFGSYAIVLITHGSGRYADAVSGERPVTAGDCILVLPDVPHTYFAPPGERGWDELYVVFSGPVFDLWHPLLQSGGLVRRAEPLEYWLPRLQRCAVNRPLEAVAAVQGFLAELLQASVKLDRTDADWLDLAIHRIGSTTRPDWHTIAADLGYGYEAFRKRFTRLSGESPARYHARRVMEQACESLRDPDRSIRHIAAACGFCDEFHFSRRFKQLMGMRPAALRERLIGSRSET